jgi:hypothetical protein
VPRAQDVDIGRPGAILLADQALLFEGDDFARTDVQRVAMLAARAIDRRGKLR